MATRRQWWWWCLLLLAAWCCAAAAQSPPAADPLQSKCQGDFGKLTDCMDYATGHAASPSSTCCGDAGDTEKARPECLCYIIQQTHTGRNQVQSLGLRFDRLMALPAACNLPNSNVSLCITLLNLKPGSADYALFANASKITPSAGGNPASDSAAGSGVKLRAGVSGGVALAVVSAIASSLF
ncbi:putative bifunctional inhibitor/LTP/seed storage protein family precursor [Zea mays]|uniref:Lipid transfer protein n=2 Tax=Zea mays TaxID=4577 RepID=B6TQP9_MAIZE|nr:putative bifunctional inhibitor/LTP/seed storage protein family precursor [Zea mays]ACG39432.1 lipid transfer protein [Zea mays]ONM03327.1 Lipid transfer protein [Zea mays]|eukprot:NP_001130434.1 putative bifunctional inhibitor/LTP/seed storage protein family precursor [Zea mays]